jgi:regulator of sigma E protease
MNIIHLYFSVSYLQGVSGLTVRTFTSIKIIDHMLWILIWIALFMFLVLIHELWHFIAAKKAWVCVEEFGIGIPPKAITLWKDKAWTCYTLNRIPLGWFVRMKGESQDEWAWIQSQIDEKIHGKSFLSVSVWWKLIILMAWIFVNTLFAWIAFSVAFMQWTGTFFVVPDNLFPIESKSYFMPSVSFLQKEGLLSGDITTIPATIEHVEVNSVAASVGIQSWDTIRAINDIPIAAFTLGKQLSQQLDTTFTITWETNEWTIKNAPITCWSDTCFLWVKVADTWQWIEVLPIQFQWWEAWKKGWHELRQQTRLTLAMLWSLGRKLFSGSWDQAAQAVNSLSWPLGIIKFGEAILTQWWVRMYLWFAWMISLALAIFNVLPIPALDGGRAMSVLIQTIWRFPAKTYYTIEWYITFAFFVLLMWLGIYIIFQDLNKFWWISLSALWWW